MSSNATKNPPVHGSADDAVVVGGPPAGDPAVAAPAPPDAAALDVPAEIREAGRLAPDHWFAVTDPAWDGDGPPPEWALAGRWRSDGAGEIAEWQENEEYRPTPPIRSMRPSNSR